MAPTTKSPASARTVAPAITGKWARSVLREQRRLMAELRAMPRPDGEPGAEPPPRVYTLADIERPAHGNKFTSRYKGIVYKCYHQQWFAYQYRATGQAGPLIGRYATELEAAMAVVAAMNGGNV